MLLTNYAGLDFNSSLKNRVYHAEKSLNSENVKNQDLWNPTQFSAVQTQYTMQNWKWWHSLFSGSTDTTHPFTPILGVPPEIDTENMGSGGDHRGTHHQLSLRKLVVRSVGVCSRPHIRRANEK